MSTDHKKLRDLAYQGAQRSHSPYSVAQVGCGLETSDGKFFSGCNIENSSYGGTVCAERVAIWKAVSEGHKQIKRVYVWTEAGWPPCGICRQVMAEFAAPDLEVVIGDGKGNESVWKFKDLLPLAFTPEHLKK